MRGMNSESVDLIYLDPHHSTAMRTTAPLWAAKRPEQPSRIPGRSVTWTKPGTGRSPIKSLPCTPLLTLPGLSHGKSMKSYLIMMAVRLLEMRARSQADWQPLSPL